MSNKVTNEVLTFSGEKRDSYARNDDVLRDTSTSTDIQNDSSEGGWEILLAGPESQSQIGTDYREWWRKLDDQPT